MLKIFGKSMVLRETLLSFLEEKPVFFFFFPFATTPTAFLVVVKRPSLNFLGDLTQAPLRELSRAELLHTSRTCST